MIHEIGSYVGDILGESVRRHGNTLSDGMRQTIGSLYRAEQVPNDEAPAMASGLDNTPKLKPLSMDF